MQPGEKVQAHTKIATLYEISCMLTSMLAIKYKVTYKLSRGR